MLHNHSPAEIIRISRWTGVGGGLGFSVFIILASLGGHLNGADLLGYIGFGSGFAMILASALITWRKNA